MHGFSRELRSLPIWLLGEYLEELGGERLRNWDFAGPGWQASLTQIEDYTIGSLRVGQVLLSGTVTTMPSAQCGPCSRKNCCGPVVKPKVGRGCCTTAPTPHLFSGFTEFRVLSVSFRVRPRFPNHARRNILRALDLVRKRGLQNPSG